MSCLFSRSRAITSLWLVVAVAPIGRATIYNAVTDFSVGSNPNGVWTYLLAGTPFPLSNGSSNCYYGGNCLQWYNGNQQPTAVSIADNVSGAAQQFITIRFATNYLSLDPESLSVGLLFTAPSSGFYQIAAQFFGDDVVGNTHPVSVIENGSTPLLTGLISHFGDKVSMDVSTNLNAGDTIAFNVNTGSMGCSFCFLSTGLWAEVSTSSAPIAIPDPAYPEAPPAPTPEPGRLAALSAGLGALALVARRRRRAIHT